jgi:hypothetical protein
MTPRLHIATPADAPKPYTEFDRQLQEARDKQRAKEAEELLATMAQQVRLMRSLDAKVRQRAQARFDALRRAR